MQLVLIHSVYDTSDAMLWPVTCAAAMLNALQSARMAVK
jgi:hypothetical protein